MTQPTIQWDKDKKKLTNHYTKSAIELMMANLKISDEKLFKEDKQAELTEQDHTRFCMTLARAMGLVPRTIQEVPSPIKKWTRRVLRIYTTKDLYEAWKNEVISTRYALDLSDYIHIFKIRDLYNQAILGQITNIQFRQLRKEQKNASS
jgi:hypothetical protein